MLLNVNILCDCTVFSIFCLFLVGMVLVMAMATSCGDRDSQESGQAREPGAGSESEGSLPGTDEEYSRESGTDSDEGEEIGRAHV